MFPMAKEKEIIYSELPIDSDKKKILRTAVKDEKLIEAINKKKEELKEKGIEVYAHKHNIIVTELGYIAAYYKS